MFGAEFIPYMYMYMYIGIEIAVVLMWESTGSWLARSTDVTPSGNHALLSRLRMVTWVEEAEHRISTDTILCSF